MQKGLKSAMLTSSALTAPYDLFQQGYNSLCEDFQSSEEHNTVDALLSNQQCNQSIIAAKYSL